jgi:phage repressor protein C with HTH and peptisase S24 domain
MDKISTIKENILYFIEKQGLTKSDFYDKTDVAASNFKGAGLKSEIGGNNIVKILTCYPEINPEWLLTGKGSMLKTESSSTGNVFRLKTDNDVQNQSVPLYDIQASASVVALFKDSSSEIPVDHITIPNLPKCDGAIYVSGDSMYPLLKSGDIIMYKKVANEIDNMFWGEMYLVSLINNDGDEFVMVKWLHKSELGTDYVKLVSENRHHQPKDFHIKNIKGLALIKASVRINSMY